jgi:uncharacterized protein YndB with AHSA1/START domain
MTDAAAKAGSPDQPTRTVAHATFHLERTYDASLARVWKALTDADARALWFGVTSEDVEILERVTDVRPGGRERLRAGLAGVSFRASTPPTTT